MLLQSCSVVRVCVCACVCACVCVCTHVDSYSESSAGLENSIMCLEDDLYTDANACISFTIFSADVTL